MLETSQTAIADASGVATIPGFTVPTGRRRFRIASIALYVDVSAPIPEAAAYLGVVSPSALLASRRAGDRGQLIGDSSDTYYPGQVVIVQWTNCAPGARCTATLRGVST